MAFIQFYSCIIITNRNTIKIEYNPLSGIRVFMMNHTLYFNIWNPITMRLINTHAHLLVSLILIYIQ